MSKTHPPYAPEYRRQMAEGRPLDLEEAEGVAHEVAVLGVGGGRRSSRPLRYIRRRTRRRW